MRPKVTQLIALTAALAAGGASACTSGTGEATAPTTSAASSPSSTTMFVTTSATTTTLAPTTTVATTTTTTTVAPTTSVAPTTAAPTTTAAPVPAAPVVAPGSALGPTKPRQQGDAVGGLQQRLLDLGYWLDAVDRRYGIVTQQAVMAFQKDHGLRVDGVAGPDTVALLNQAQPRAHGQAGSGDLIEVDKAKQVLYIVRGGQTLWALNTSTGSGQDYTELSEKTGREISGTAVTPEGRFRVQREKPDGWWEGELGDLYRPKYFRGGVAVHGSNRIPNYPASHGCVRVSTAAMDYIWAQNLMPLRSAVWVHSG